MLQYWNSAYDKFVEAATSGDGATVVAFHPSFYSARRSELYSTLGRPITRVDDLRYDHVVLLIDDIYDIHRRLGSKGDIYDLQRRLDRHLLSQKLDAYRGPADQLDPADRIVWWQLRAENVNATLTEIAMWRRFDMVQAELLARAHGCPLTVLGVKHPFRSLRQLLSDPLGTTTSYLSHPISRPRRAVLSGSTQPWPDVVLSSNRLGDRLAGEGIDLIMPTSIDEFRIAPAPDSAKPLARPYQLGVRWPNLSPTGAILENDRPADLPLEPEEPAILELGPYARALEKMIIGEVPFRDHFLVSNTDAFLVYRPLFGMGNTEDRSERGGSYSGGVQAEIDHWVDCWSTEQRERKRRAIFVHCLADIKEIAWLWAGESPADPQQRELHKHGLQQALRQYLRESYGLKHADVESILRGEDLRDDMLDSAVIDASHNVAELRSRAYEQAGLGYLVQYLTGGIERQEILESGDVVVYLTRHDELSDDELNRVAQFLRSSSPWTTVLVDDTGVLVEGLGANSLGDWVAAVLEGE
ncbi:hypothetical protein [Agromyces sp. LHK192]|uniref:hypothetical protein n=1 Tax=Agromyces sp. LHK192 TaxID=2498704 RepID=UPI00196B1400|nr:hypothetical protein [Agromyces sp. LHK192]